MAVISDSKSIRRCLISATVVTNNKHLCLTSIAIRQSLLTRTTIRYHWAINNYHPPSLIYLFQFKNLWMIPWVSSIVKQVEYTSVIQKFKRQ